jgi:hypothetical protein
MRPATRIYKYLNLFLKNLDKTDLKDNEKQIILDNKKTIFKYWKENPDQRLGQMLFNLFNLNSFSLSNYHKEDFDYLISLGIPARDLLLWGSYGKSGNEKYHHLWIDDMESMHIYNILNTERNIDSNYRDVFEKELLDRNFELQDPKYGKVFGKIMLFSDFIEEDLVDNLCSDYLENIDCLDVIGDFESFGVDLYVDYVENNTDTFYFEIDVNEMSKENIIQLMANVVRLVPDEFEEVSPNVFKIWWD